MVGNSDIDSGSGLGAMVSVDTTFVLFFLALEYGRAIQMFSLEGAVTGTTMLMVLVLPYFLPSAYDKPALAAWVAGRTAIAILAMISGVILKLSIGVYLPESFRFVPFMGLILATVISFYVQFYGLIRLRPAK